MREAVIAEIERAAAVREPAHDDLVRRDHLLPVDAEVLPRLVRPARDGEAPGDERRASPGQQVCTGSRARSTSSPSQHDLLARRAEHRLRRHVEHLHAAAASCPRRPSALAAARAPSGTRAACRSRAAPRPSSSTPIASATRRGVPNRLPSTGIACPVGRSNSSAGPPAFSTRSQISVISRRGSTSAAMRFSSPRASSWARKSRRSRYFIGVLSALSAKDREAAAEIEQRCPRTPRHPPNCCAGTP